MRFFRAAAFALLAIYGSGIACAQVIGDMFASDASVRGSVLFSNAGTQIQSGSSVTAGDAAAVVKLKRGGEVRICPGTTISVAASANGNELLWGMNVGSIESNFTLSASADTVMTPDFRILLAGPGIFHFAISSDAKGNACVRALPANTASLIVTEINGSGTYQVKPNVQVLFRNGSVSDPSPFVPPDCGCPAPVPVERAQTPPPERLIIITGGSQKPPPIIWPKRAEETTEAAANYPQPPLPAATDVFTPSQPLPPNSQVHLQMESPLVYSPADPEMEMVMAVSRLRLTAGSNFDKPMVLPPPEAKPQVQPTVRASAKPQSRKGFFAKIGSFFSSIFK